MITPAQHMLICSWVLKKFQLNWWKQKVHSEVHEQIHFMSSVKVFSTVIVYKSGRGVCDSSQRIIELLSYREFIFIILFLLSGLYYAVDCWVDASIMEKHTAYPEDGSRMFQCFVGTHPLGYMMSWSWMLQYEFLLRWKIQISLDIVLARLSLCIDKIIGNQ